MGASDNKNRAVKKDKLSAYSWLIFSDEDYEGYKRFIRFRSGISALAVILLSILVYIFITEANRTPADINELLVRSSEDREAELDLTARYMDQTVEESVVLSVLPKAVDRQTSEILFDDCEIWLKEMLAEKLQFPEAAPNGVEISWQNTDFSYLGIEEPEERTFIAQLSAGEYLRLSEFTVLVDPTDEDYRESLISLADELGESLSQDDRGDTLQLPDNVNGAELTWSVRRKEAPTTVIAAGVFIASVIILTRRDNEKKQLIKRQNMFEREVPDLCFQLVLYLNAGLIVESAFSRIISQNEESREPLYRALRDIKKRSETGNTSLITEIYSYARSAGSQSFLRIASLCYEHAARGSELSEKLDQERLRLQNDRLTDVRAEIGSAETRLCFPLMLLLAALIIITVLPSFLSM